MKRIFLIIIMVGLSHAVLSMQTAGETPRPPVELLAEAINNHDLQSFELIFEKNKESLTGEEWRSLRIQNLECIKAILEIESAYSCWRPFLVAFTGDKHDDQRFAQGRIETLIVRKMKELHNKNQEARLTKIETLLAEHSRLLATLFPEKHSLVQEQPQIISEDVKQ